MHMPNFPDDTTPAPSTTHEFLSTLGATVAGAYIGHRFDQSRAGIWFNNNATIDRIWRAMISLLKLAIVAGVLYFMYLVYTTP